MVPPKIFLTMDFVAEVFRQDALPHNSQQKCPIRAPGLLHHSVSWPHVVKGD